MMKYNLWDIETGNLFGQYTDEVEALKLVRLLVSRYGADYAECLSLGRVRDDGTIIEPIAGIALAEHAERVDAERERAEARPVAFVPSRGNTGRSGTGRVLPLAAAGRTWAVRRAVSVTQPLRDRHMGRAIQAPPRGRRRKD